MSLGVAQLGIILPSIRHALRPSVMLGMEFAQVLASTDGKVFWSVRAAKTSNGQATTGVIERMTCIRHRHTVALAGGVALRFLGPTLPDVHLIGALSAALRLIVRLRWRLAEGRQQNDQGTAVSWEAGCHLFGHSKRLGSGNRHASKSAHS